MQTVSLHNYHSKINGNRFSQTSFQAAPVAIDSKLSLKAQGLIRRASTYLEDAWTAIRKGELLMEEPNFIGFTKNNEVVTLKPVYNGRNSMLLEISKDKHIENIIIDRTKQDNFTYEKRVLTDHGSATLKSYNSKRDNNMLLEETINKKIELGLEAILPKLSIRQMLAR